MSRHGIWDVLDLKTSLERFPDMKLDWSMGALIFSVCKGHVKF